MDSDTIIAPATPPGTGALALLRVSGPEAAAFTEKLLRRPIAWKPQRLWHRELYAVEAVEAGETLLDEVVLSYWQSPRSFTGEEVIEISCHGNPFLVRKIIAAYLTLGARTAQPGEFAQRAFLNGKIDLTQAEAIADLITAATDREIAGAQAMREGQLGERMQSIRSALIDLLAHLEAYIDFPDEDIAPETGGQFATSVATTLEEVRALIATAPLGRILRQGVITAIVGAPNVGKSSLFNTLLREDRAIVSPTPGTTRDIIEVECRIGPFRLRLLDTAGHRETGDPIEAEGVRRATAAAAKAELIIHLIEASLPFSLQPPPPPFPPGGRVLRIASKCDLGLAPENKAAGYLPLSTQTGEGLDILPAQIEALLLDGEALPADPLTVNARQEASLRAAAASLETALTGLHRRPPLAPELTSLSLREALRAIGEVVGAATNEDILDALFSKFCLGK